MSGEEEEWSCGCCWHGKKVGREHTLLWGRASGNQPFPLQGMVGPDYRTTARTAVAIALITSLWAAAMIELGPVLSNFPRSACAFIALGGLVLGALNLLLFFATACSNPGLVLKDEGTAAAVGDPDPTTAVHMEAGGQAGGQQQTAAVAEDNVGAVAEDDIEAVVVRSVGDRRSRTQDTVECVRCEIMRPRDAKHCSLCRACVRGLDHHCPFVGQCIGARNLLFFYGFVSSLWLLIVYLIVSCLAVLVRIVTARG